jgi:hypothetical protein
MSLASRRREALGESAGRGDKIKMGVMIVLLIAVLAIFALLPVLFGGCEQKPEDTPVDAGAVPERDEGIRNEAGSVLEETTGGGIRAEAGRAEDDDLGLGPEKKVDLARLEAIRDDTDQQRGQIEPEALDYLLDHVHNEPSVRRKRRGFRAIDPRVMLERPEAFRGLAVELRGELLGWERMPHEGVEGVTHVYRGFLDVHRRGEDGADAPIGVQVSFTATEKPQSADANPKEFGPGTFVRLQGFFLKLWRGLPPGAEELTTTPHVVARRFLRSYQVVPQREVDPSWFKVADGHSLDEPPFFLLLNYLKNLTPEAFRERRASGVLNVTPIPEPGQPFPPGPVPENVITDFGSRGKLLYDNTDRFRGRLVRLRGTLKRVDPVVPGDNPGGIERIYDGFLAQETYLIPIRAPFPLARYGVEESPLVHLEGYLYKRWMWEGKGGGRFTAPMILVTNIEPQYIPDSPLLHAQWVLGGVAAVFAVVLVVMLVLDRRSTKRHEERRRKRRGARGDRIGGGAATDGADEAAGPDSVGDGEEDESP